MPLWDYVCDPCRAILPDQYRSVVVGARGHLPACPSCTEPMRPLIPSIAVDASNGASFQAFDLDVDHHRVHIDSLHTARKVEQISEQRYRNGEGEPIRFRMLNNDRSNRDKNSFGETGTIGDRTYASGDAPAPRRKKIGVTRHGEHAPDHLKAGPGMHGRIASSLKG